MENEKVDEKGLASRVEELRVALQWLTDSVTELRKNSKYGEFVPKTRTQEWFSSRDDLMDLGDAVSNAGRVLDSASRSVGEMVSTETRKTKEK